MAVWLSFLELGFCGYALYKEAQPSGANIDGAMDNFLVGHTHANQSLVAANTTRALFKDCVLPDSLGHKVGIKMWIYVQMGMAALNLLFAPYLQ
jgi:hypothetical protein